MMRIDILTVLPEMLESPLGCSILKRAQQKGLVEFHVHNLRDYTTNRHRKVDDYPFGGEAGMVMQVEPVDRAIGALKAERDYDEVIFTSPDGDLLTQPMANRLSLLQNVIILCGHYKGIDWRIREHLVTKEISIGDYVLTGGELGALVLIDCVSRLCPGDLADESCFTEDSHFNGLLEYPQYTKPAVWHGIAVPEIITNGNHAAIARWRREMSLKNTWEKRPEMLKTAPLTEKDRWYLRTLGWKEEP